MTISKGKNKKDLFLYITASALVLSLTFLYLDKKLSTTISRDFFLNIVQN